jgi:hypothetical protein
MENVHGKLLRLKNCFIRLWQLARHTDDAAITRPDTLEEGGEKRDDLSDKSRPEFVLKRAFKRPSRSPIRRVLLNTSPTH